jgi:hypothetical protein
MFGNQGFHQTTLAFNLANPVDVNSPTLVAFKVLNGNTVSPEIVRGFPASVHFTVGDFTYTSPSQRIYHSVKDVQLLYKRYEDTTYLPISLAVDPAGLDSLSGMPYLADLQPVMNAYPDSAFIDLKVILTDSVGNVNTQTMHPAFLLRDVITGTGNIGRNAVFSLYPNPAADKVAVISNEKEFILNLYSSQGQSLIEKRNCREIDVSGLMPGIYFVGVNGKFMKLVKQ